MIVLKFHSLNRNLTLNYVSLEDLAHEFNWALIFSLSPWARPNLYNLISTPFHLRPISDKIKANMRTKISMKTSPLNSQK